MCDILLQLTLIKKTFLKSHMHISQSHRRQRYDRSVRLSVHSLFAGLFLGL